MTSKENIARFYESAGIQILLNNMIGSWYLLANSHLIQESIQSEDGRKVEIKALLKQVQKDYILISLLF